MGAGDPTYNQNIYAGIDPEMLAREMQSLQGLSPEEYRRRLAEISTKYQLPIENFNVPRDVPAAVPPQEPPPSPWGKLAPIVDAIPGPTGIGLERVRASGDLGPIASEAHASAVQREGSPYVSPEMRAGIAARLGRGQSLREFDELDERFNRLSRLGNRHRDENSYAPGFSNEGIGRTLAESAAKREAGALEAADKPQIPWLEVVKAGLNIAAGQSDDPIQNIAGGMGTAIEDYESRAIQERDLASTLELRSAKAALDRSQAEMMGGAGSAEHARIMSQAMKIAEGNLTTIVDESGRMTPEFLVIYNTVRSGLYGTGLSGSNLITGGMGGASMNAAGGYQ